MHTEVEIPDFLSHLPVDPIRKYPIPFFVPIVDGKPDFKYADGSKKVLCYEKNLCWVCGRKHDRRSLWNVSGPVGLQNRTHSDPPMHERCARFSLIVCPHLFFQKTQRTSIPNPAMVDVHVDTFSELYLVRIDKVKPFNFSGDILYTFRPLYSEKFIYTDGKLTKDETYKRRHII